MRAPLFCYIEIVILTLSTRCLGPHERDPCLMGLSPLERTLLMDDPMLAIVRSGRTLAVCVSLGCKRRGHIDHLPLRVRDTAGVSHDQRL